MTDVAKYQERIRYFSIKRRHSDPAVANRAQENLDWWLDKYAAHLKAVAAMSTAATVESEADRD